MKTRRPHWDPPDVDRAFHTHGASPPCVLSAVLEEAGARADEMVNSLQDFTAQERIEYRMLGNILNPLGGGIGVFDYTVTFERRSDGLSVQEGRVPERGSSAFPVSAQDVGLPEIALIFHSDFRDDYELKCEGAGNWNGQPTWVVHFQQRRDKQSKTASFGDKGTVYPVRLKGRAWIARESGEVVHLETGLMEALPAINVQEWYLSIDYAPVQFLTRDVRIWLPETVDAYCNFGLHRTISYHTFTNFLLFSVQTDEVIGKPQNP
ncbi:MAG TPA: hypothetical protein VN830_00190 [Verrucomicrobiae bacterium]|nr:hypothetical protein [Verrucomicrobiae bacterium]